MSAPDESAFPEPGLSGLPNGDVIFGRPGMTAREYAAIHLCVPTSGTDWLDEMIRDAQRDRLAAKAMEAELASAGANDEAADALLHAAEEEGRSVEQQIAFNACAVADAVLAELEK